MRKAQRAFLTAVVFVPLSAAIAAAAGGDETPASAAAGTTQPAAAAASADAKPAGVEWLQELPFGDTPVPTVDHGLRISLGASTLDFGNHRETELSLEADYGLSDRLQLEATFPYVWTGDKEGGTHHRADGIGDIAIGALYSLVATDNFLLSFSLDFALPTGDAHRDLGGGSVTIEPTISAAVAVDKYQLFASVGGSLGSGDDSVEYDFTVARPIGAWAPLVEFSGQTSQEGTELYVIPGLSLRANSNLELVVGVPLGLTRESADVGVAFQFTFTR